MKKSIVLLVLISLATTAWCQSPNADEWFRQKKTQKKYLIKQIAGLKIYLEYLKEGYRIVDKGLSTIGQIRTGTHDMDNAYVVSLRQINPVVGNSPKINEVLEYNRLILQRMRALATICNADDNFSASEVSYICSVRDKMIGLCMSSIDELSILTTASAAQMRDDERLNRLDKVHLDMQEHYAFAQDFAQSTRLLSRQRAKEKSSIRISRQRYEI